MTTYEALVQRGFYAQGRDEPLYVTDDEIERLHQETGITIGTTGVRFEVDDDKAAAQAAQAQEEATRR